MDGLFSSMLGTAPPAPAPVSSTTEKDKWASFPTGAPTSAHSQTSSSSSAAATGAPPKATSPPPARPKNSSSSSSSMAAGHTGAKHRQRDEGVVPNDYEETTTIRRARSGGGYSSRFATARGKQYHTSRTTRVERGYMSAKGKESRRFAAMTQRDLETEWSERQSELSRRESARKSARRAALNRTPLPTTKPAPQNWRQWPGGRPGTVEVDDAWAYAEANYEAELEQRGRPPLPAKQSSKQYGSSRPMSAKQRRLQVESMMENRARKRLQMLREQEKERRAGQKLEETEVRLAHMGVWAREPSPSPSLSASRSHALTLSPTQPVTLSPSRSLTLHRVALSPSLSFPPHLPSHPGEAGVHARPNKGLGLDQDGQRGDRQVGG